MNKLRRWWNMMYYFHLKWYMWIGDIITYPLYRFYKTDMMKKAYRKIHKMEYDESFLRESERKSGINDLIVEYYMGMLIGCFFFGVLIVMDIFLDNFTFFENNTTYLFLIIGGIPAFVLSNYLSEEKKRCLCIKELDMKFKKSKSQRRKYEFLCFLSGFLLWSWMLFSIWLYVKICV